MRFAAVCLGFMSVLLTVGCQPLRDLDAAASNPDDNSVSSPNATTNAVAVTAPASPSMPAPSVDSTSAEQPPASPVTPSQDETDGAPVVAPTGDDPVVPTVETDGGAAGGDTSAPSPAPLQSPGGFGGMEGSGSDLQSGGAGGSENAGGGGSTTAPPDAGEPLEAPELPLDLPGNPVPGTFAVAIDAEWEVDGVYLPTFEIITPTAGYWVVKQLGTIVSMADTDAEDPRQWIDFSSGFRPLRGLPSFGTFDTAPVMTTTLDEDSQTPTHVRLESVSETDDWKLVYDFYPTHVTLTVEVAPVPFGLAYRGVPAGGLDAGDRFVFADGTSQDATISSVVDLPGPVEWAHLTDLGAGRSMFLIHHGDDDLVDRFQIRDNDSTLFSFGDGELTELPALFSFGIVPSADHDVVAQRATFVVDAIPWP